MKKITLLLLLVSAPLFAATIFVNSDATGNNTGLTWTNAYSDLQLAINNATIGDQIFVKSGTYYPSQLMISGNNRSKAFVLTKNIKIYGGFSGTESTVSERNIVANPTILSGDFNGNDTDTNGNGINDFGQTENAYTVIIAYGLSNAALIDGFRIFGGCADGTATYTYNTYSLNTANAGGIYNIASNLVVKNTRFINNSGDFGGGICNKGACFPKIESCEFSYNYASYGGAIHANDASLITILNSTFSSNRGSGALSSLNNSVMKATGCTFNNNQGTSGGVIYNNNYCSAVFLNCIMRNNTASSSGGAFYNTTYSTCTLYNTLVYKNYAIYGGAVYNVSNSYINCINSTFYGNNASTKGGAFYCSVSPDNMYMKLYNTIIYGNTSPSNANIFWEYYTLSNIHVRNSIIQGCGGSSNWGVNYGTNDGFNLDANPLFTNTTQDTENFTLQTGSPGIDASYNLLLNLPNTNNSWTPSDTDVYGNSRLIGNGVDIGAAENGTLSVPENTKNKLSFFYENSCLFFNTTESLNSKTIYIYNITGALVFKGMLVAEIIRLPNLKNGIYFLKIEGNESAKFIVD